jgi:hypothetical protein
MRNRDVYGDDERHPFQIWRRPFHISARTAQNLNKIPLWVPAAQAAASSAGRPPAQQTPRFRLVVSAPGPPNLMAFPDSGATV